jgi:hypothetical protein
MEWFRDSYSWLKAQDNHSYHRQIPVRDVLAKEYAQQKQTLFQLFGKELILSKEV